MNKPEPTPEGALIRRVRLASGQPITSFIDALRHRGIQLSVSRWSQVENGYEGGPGRRKPVTAPPGTLAWMAFVLDISPSRLTEASRADAAEVLEEIQLREVPARPAQQKDRILALIESAWGSLAAAPEYVQVFAQAGQFPEPFRYRMIKRYIDGERDPSLAQAAASGFTPETERDILRAADILRRRQAGPPRTAENGDTERAANGSEG
jgi:hypothetical protein